MRGKQCFMSARSAGECGCRVIDMPNMLLQLGLFGKGTCRQHKCLMDGSRPNLPATQDTHAEQHHKQRRNPGLHAQNPNSHLQAAWSRVHRVLLLRMLLQANTDVCCWCAGAGTNTLPTRDEPQGSVLLYALGFGPWPSSRHCAAGLTVGLTEPMSAAFCGALVLCTLVQTFIVWEGLI